MYAFRARQAMAALCEAGNPVLTHEPEIDIGSELSASAVYKLSMFGLSVSLFRGVTIVGFHIRGLRFFSFLLPQSAPLALAPLLVVLELISLLSCLVSSCCITQRILYMIRLLGYWSGGHLFMQGSRVSISGKTEDHAAGSGDLASFLQMASQRYPVISSADLIPMTITPVVERWLQARPTCFLQICRDC